MVIDYDKINADWLKSKINLHYNSMLEFTEDGRHRFSYSMISKHCSDKQKMTDRYKNHYYLFFLALENGLI